jgi:predicted AAA+ superfamily ATPase
VYICSTIANIHIEELGDSLSHTYIPRSLEPVLKKAFSQFPAVVLVGPRQSGKTTLLKHLFGDQCPIVSLEPPDVRFAALSDPRGFLDLYPPPVVFDEIQVAPALLPYIKELVDSHRDRPGQYILTGSQNLLLMQQVTESLAGRAAVLQLLPMSQWEVDHHPQGILPWEKGKVASPPPPGQPVHDLWAHILRGFYPEIVSDPDREARLWQASYVQTYLERDIRNLRNIGDLTLFQTFLRALASRCGQILNLSSLARDVGVSVNTAKDWISLLEASFQVFLLRPFYANIGKRLVKSPKVYFIDTGLLCYLVGLRDPGHAASGPMGGAIFENLVVAELFKIYFHRGEEPVLYYWRTAAGSEVDLVVDTQEKLIPIEIKLSATPRPEMAREIVKFQKDFEGKAGLGYVIHPGQMTLPLGKDVRALPLANL